MRRRKLDAAVLFGQKNILSLIGVGCDNGALVIDGERIRYATDSRYVPAVRRTALSLPVTDCHRDLERAVCRFLHDVRPLRRIGFEGDVPASRYLALSKCLSRATFVDIGSDMLGLRAVKTPVEIARVTAAEALNDRIWNMARRDFRPGMTEKEIQRIIRAYMNALGDGEVFETIVCAGANAAEYHHVPDGTVWHKGEALLVDMGVKLDGVCSDMTRAITPRGAFYFFPKAPGGDDLKFVDVLQDELILAVPGRGFGMAGHVRLSCSVDEAIIARSADGFKRAVAACV